MNMARAAKELFEKNLKYKFKKNADENVIFPPRRYSVLTAYQILYAINFCYK